MSSSTSRNTGISVHLPEGTVLSRLTFRDWNGGDTVIVLKNVTVVVSNWNGITVSTDFSPDLYLPAHIVQACTVASLPDVIA